MKKAHKGLIISAVVLALIIVTGGLLVMFGIKSQDYKEEFAIDGHTILEINNTYGNISIWGWEKDYIEVEAVKKSVLGLFMKNVNIDVRSEGRFIINTEYGSKLSKTVKVEYILKIPKKISVEKANALSGNISIENISGDVSVQTTSGKISIKNVYGVQAQTSSGSIDIYNAGGDITAKSDSGRINVKASGSIKSIETVSGNISVEILSINNDIEINSKSGKVTVIVFQEIDAVIELTTSSGRISYDDMPIKVTESSKRKLTAILGKANSTIKVKTASGAVILKSP